MSTEILATKLYTPPSRPGFILRQRLINQLNVGFYGKLTLASAPAGFGKTTLVSEWITSIDKPAAWLSLDESDNAPVRFLTYVVAALQTIAPQFGADFLNLLDSSQPPSIDSLLIPLLNNITGISNEFVLVLDDYHILESTEIDTVLTFLVDNQPPHMHLVIITREDPHLPLARLRARGQLIELRAADLRFTSEEAAEFLNQSMRLSLSPEDVEALEQRTEGWIVGLQLAALSLQGQQDTNAFIQSFTGSHHFVLDYLIEEVLRHQPPPIHDFLLKTSILDRMCASLCAAVLQDDSDTQTMLEGIRQANLFLISLDNERSWFRYHHLFRDLLRRRLQQRASAEINNLHIRASIWYEDHDLRPTAIHHALAAQDFDRVADLIELAWPDMDGRFQTDSWLGWVARLPDKMIHKRPVLSVDYAWALMQRGELEATEVHLRNAETLLSAETGEMVVADEVQFQTLPATIASARAYLAQALGDVAATVRYGQQALDLLPENHHLQRGIASSLLGVAYFANGDLEFAHHTLAQGMAALQAAGNLLFAIRGTYVLADIRLTQGRLQDAIRIYEESLQLATQEGEVVLRGAADLYLRLSELYAEQNNLEAATKLRLRGEELSEQKSSPIWRYRLCLAQSRIKQAEGDFEATLALLNEAEHRYVRTPVPDIHPIAAMKARVWIIQGRLSEVQAWVKEQDLSVNDDLSFLREYEHLTLARLLIAQHRSGILNTIQPVMGLLERLLNAAESGGRVGSVIEILVQQALAYEAQANIYQALASLECALALAEPEDYVRIFIDEGDPMRRMLSELAARGVMPDYTRKLLAASQNESGQSRRISTQPLIEPLSERELEILVLVADGLSNGEISERLYLALSTVKGHNRNIFDKLQVKRRTEAVARARELGLI